MSAIPAAFPTRPLVLHRPKGSVGAWFIGLLGAVFFLAAGAAITYEATRGLVSDWQVRGAAQPMPGARILRGRCASRLALLHDCEVSLAYRPVKASQDAVREIHYLFVEPRFGDFTARVMGDPGRPELLTTDIGLDRFWNRVATLIVLDVLVLGLVVGSLLYPLRARRAARALRALSGQRLTPVPAHVARQRDNWVVTPLAGGVPSIWPVPRKVEPFWVNPERGVALAVTAPGGPVFALDGALRWIELTEEERARLRAAAGQGAAAPGRPA